jgi:hypothetical protein
LILKDGSETWPVPGPVFKTGGRRVTPSSVGSTPTRFRHCYGNNTGCIRLKIAAKSRNSAILVRKPDRKNGPPYFP